MTEDHRLKPALSRVEIELGKIMQDENSDVIELEDFTLAKLLRKGGLVDIAAHCNDGRHNGQFFEDLRPADVTGVNDEVAWRKRGDGRGPQ